MLETEKGSTRLTGTLYALGRGVEGALSRTLRSSARALRRRRDMQQ